MKSHRSYLFAGAALGVCLIAAPALAQDRPTQVDEVVVTAQKRTERLQNVPAAISVVTDKEIEQIGARSTRDLINFVPGLALQSDGYNNTLIIRGISPGGVSTPLVGTIIDGVPNGSSSGVAFGGTSAIDVNLADVERVEVLKGPQGTLYGASAMGGLLSYVMKSSIPTAVEGSGSIDGYGTRYGAGSFLAQASIAVPLISDKAALRVSAFYNDIGGFIDNPRTATPNANEMTSKGGRVALNLRPIDKLQIDLSGLYQLDERDSSNIAAFLPNRQPLIGPLDSNYALLRTGRREFQQYTARENLDLGFAQLTSMTSWASTKSAELADLTDTSFGPLFRLFNPAAQTAYGHTDPTTQKLTQELRLVSPNSTGFRWLAGVFYTRENSYMYQGFYGADAGGTPVAGLAPAVAVVVPSDYEEYAAFGNVTVPIGDRLELTGGLRVSHNNQRFQQNAIGPLAAIFGLAAFGPLSKSEADRLDYLGSAKYQITPTSMVYARTATGYRAGGPNVAFLGVPPTYGPDQLTNYEAGFKSSFLDGRGSIDFAAFYIDWKDIQVTAVNAAGNGYFANGGKARSQGFEATGILHPVQGLSLTGSFAYTDAKLSEDIPSLFAKAGERLPNSPEWSGSLIAEYRHPVTDDLTAVLGANYQYVGARTNSYAASKSPPLLKMDAYSQVDVRVGVETARYSITAFVRNLTDERADLTTGFSAGTVFASQLRPRQVGVRLSASF